MEPLAFDGAASLDMVNGQRVVVKLGGEVMLNSPGLETLAADVVLLARSGVGVVVVHGGGPQADDLAQRLGHTVRKVGGRRITDDDALEVAKMVYGGSINVDLLAALKRRGGRGVGLSGVDGDLITAVRRPPVRGSAPKDGAEEWVDFGHVGDVEHVDGRLLESLMELGYIPVVASLAADREGNILNINADTVAQALAANLRADRLVLVTNVPGILLDPDDPASLISTCDSAEVQALVEAGVISGGMLPKVHNCIQALEADVRSVQILDGTGRQVKLLDSVLGGKAGTVITRG
jgi:acetylglutamate kinase